MAVLFSRRNLFLVSLMAMGYFLFDVVGNMVSTDLSNTLDPTTSLKGRYIIYVLVIAFAACLIYGTKRWEASPERVATTASSHSAVDMPSQEMQQYSLDNSVQSILQHFPTGRAGDLDHTGVGSPPPNDPHVRAHIERPFGVLPIFSASLPMTQLQAMTMAQLQAEGHSRSAPVPQEPSTACQYAPTGGELRIRKICPTCPICGSTDCVCHHWIDDVEMEGVQFPIPRSSRQSP